MQHWRQTAAHHRQAQRLWLCADRPTTTAVHSCTSTACPLACLLVPPAAGRTRISLRRTGELYSHVPPSAKVHNLVLGKTWIDSFGSFHVRNVNTGVRVEMEFKPCGWFGSNQYEFEGLVLDEQVRGANRGRAGTLAHAIADWSLGSERRTLLLRTLAADDAQALHVNNER